MSGQVMMPESRKQNASFVLTLGLIVWIKERAGDLGISDSEFVRRALTEARAREESEAAA